MTTPSTERKAGPLLGTGAQTTWPFTFKVFAPTDIAVTIANSLGVETQLVYGVDFNVTLNANQETSPGGTVTYPISGSPLPVGSRLVIVGNLPYDQPLDLPSGGNFSPLALENQLDRLTMQIQQLRERVGRALQVSVTTGANVGLPAPSANELIGWDSTGSTLQNFAVSELATAVAYATMRYDTFAGDGTTTQFTLTADPVTLANLDVAISGVTQMPGTDYSLLNGVLVFTSAPANGTQILARYGEGLVNVGGDSSDIRFLQAGTGAKDRTVQAKLREFVSVFDFMTPAEIAGVQSGAKPDVTSAIQAAITAGRVIYFPPGQYKISATINWENQWLIGALDNGTLSTAANQTMIIADGTFPAFRYFNPGGFNAHGGGIKNFNIFFADGTEPATVTTRPNAIGIFIGPSDGYPAFHTFENITVRGGQWGVFDDSGSWMAIYNHIQTHDCIGGIYKKGGTTHTLNACYHRNGKAGFHFTDVLGVALNACAVDLCDTDVPGYFPVFVENSTVTFNGCDFEGIKLNGDFREIVRSNGQQALVQLNACRFLATSVTAATETYMVRATSGGKIQLNGVDFTPTSYTGSGGVFAYLVAIQGGTVSATDTLMPALTGSTPAAAYQGLATTAGVVDVNNCVSSYPLFGTAYRMDKSIRFSVTHDFASIPANSSVTNVFTVTGAAVGDFVMVSLETNVTGVVFNAWVSAANTVSVSAHNLTGSAIDLPSATLRIGVTQK